MDLSHQAGRDRRFNNPEYYGGPMIPFDTHHDTGAKILFNGVTLPAGGTTQADLTAALQKFSIIPTSRPLFPTTHSAPGDQQSQPGLRGPGGGGIQRQRQRRSRRLEGGGHGDPAGPEARRGDDPAQAQANDGHLKEPVLFITNLLRG